MNMCICKLYIRLYVLHIYLYIQYMCIYIYTCTYIYVRDIDDIELNFIPTPTDPAAPSVHAHLSEVDLLGVTFPPAG